MAMDTAGPWRNDSPLRTRRFWKLVDCRKCHHGGEGGIRTHGTGEGTPHFECGAFDHSATSPKGFRRGLEQGAEANEASHVPQGAWSEAGGGALPAGGR